MAKDRRYKAAKKLIESGDVVTFREIFDYVPKTRVTLDLGTNHTRFGKLLNNPDLFTLRELTTLASFLDIEPKILINLAYDQAISDKKGKSKR